MAYVGITRAREQARISFAANRLVYGRWTSQLPSRFVDELPVAHVEAASGDRLLRRRTRHGRHGLALGRREHLRFGLYLSWLEAGAGSRQRRGICAGGPVRAAVRGQVIEGDGRLIASSDPSAASGSITRGDRVFPPKVRLRHRYERRGEPNSRSPLRRLVENV